jgi:hypothetical protein
MLKSTVYIKKKNNKFLVPPIKQEKNEEKEEEERIDDKYYITDRIIHKRIIKYNDSLQIDDTRLITLKSMGFKEEKLVNIYQSITLSQYLYAAQLLISASKTAKEENYKTTNQIL